MTKGFQPPPGIQLNHLNPVESAMRAISEPGPVRGDHVVVACPDVLVHAPLELSRAAQDLSSDLFALQGHLMRRAMGCPRKTWSNPIPTTPVFRPGLEGCGHLGHRQEWYLAFSTASRTCSTRLRGFPKGTQPRRLLVPQMAQCYGADQFLLAQPGGHAALHRHPGPKASSRA